MTQVHRQEKEQFRKLFKDNLLDRFEDRFAILEVFLQTEQHVTVRELSRLLEERGYGFAADFVREALNIMCRLGFAHMNRFEDGKLRYEHRHLGDHHDHLICTKCRQVIEFNSDRMEQLQIDIAADHGFHMLQHRMEIYGICNRCLGNRNQLLPLALSRPGEELVIKEILGGTGMRLRLTAMGLRVGDPIRVITNNRRGKLVVAAGQKRYVLGREMARKIHVQLEEQHR